MKRFLLAICCAMVFASIAYGQNTRPAPVGITEAAKPPNPANVPPLIGPQRKLPDAAQLKREAAELASLAQSIPSKIDQLAVGHVPSDLNKQLKEIEKLAKRLRREASQ